MANKYWTDDKRKEAMEIICHEIAVNNKSLRKIIRETDRKHVPEMPTFMEWLIEDKEIANQYARATEIRAENIFEEILEIADDTSNDTLINKEGDEYLNQEFVQRSRVKIDARKWMLSKMMPKKYGDKQEIDLNVKEMPIIKFTDAE